MVRFSLLSDRADFLNSLDSILHEFSVVFDWLVASLKQNLKARLISFRTCLFEFEGSIGGKFLSVGFSVRLGPFDLSWVLLLFEHLVTLRCAKSELFRVVSKKTINFQIKFIKKKFGIYSDKIS